MKRKTREKVCTDCGAVFLASKFSTKCDACRDKARKKDFEHICPDCGKTFIGTKNTKFCRECKTKRMVEGRKNAGSFYCETPESIEYEFRKVKGNRDPLPVYEECPNYCKDFVKCITCPAGSWRYKGCGTAKSAKDTSTNSN